MNTNTLSKSCFFSSTSKSDPENLNKSTNAGLQDDSVRVEVRRMFSQPTLNNWHELHEICELDTSCPNATTISLMRCKKQVLHPFRNLLCLIGWRPFGVDSIRWSSKWMRVLNVVYPIFVFTLLIFNYVYEIIVCQGIPNSDRTSTATTITTSTPSLTESMNTTMMNRYMSSSRNNRHHHLHNTTECGHIVTVYIVPDILHCAAFLIGFIYFRTTEGEPMYSLMEKVFIHADQNMPLFSPNRVIRRLKIFLLIGGGWVLASVAVHALTVIITNFDHHGILDGLNNSNEKSMQYSLFIIDVFCLLVKNCIHIAVAINFVCHCEMVVFYCKGIRTRLEEKSIPLLEAMKQILDVRLSISELNSAVSRMMSLLVVYFLDRIVLGIICFIANDRTEPLVYVYRSLYPIVWLSILLCCLSQAARVTSKCDKFHRIAHSMRVYGYHSATPNELDGFVLFISAAQLRAKLLGLTIRPGNVIAIIVTIMIACIILIQTNLIRSPQVSL